MVSKEINQTEALGTERVGKLLFRLAVPAIAAQLINLLYNIVDRIYIGHIEGIGKLALTGVGVCLPLIMVITAFAALISMGGAPRASISLGKGDKKSAERILGNSVTLLVLISLTLTVLFQLFAKDLLLAFGASDNTIGYATDYLRIYSLGTLFVQLTLGLNAFIAAQGFAKISMLTVLIGAVSNIILDPIFIFVLNLGVKGAAIATIISQSFSMIWILFFLTGKKTTLKIRAQYLKLQPKIFLPCLALGLAPFIMQASESALNICFNTSLLKYGGDLAVGAMTILTSVMQLSFLPLAGLAQGAQPIISYNYGAKNAKRVRQAFKLLLRSCVIFSLTLWALVQLWPQGFIRIFNNDKALIEFAVPALRIYLLVSCMMGIQIGCQQTFLALGKAKSSLSIAVLRKIVVLIPLIYIMPRLPLPVSKTTAIYLAEPIADTISVAYTVVLFFFVFNKTLREIEQEPDEHRQSGLFLFLRKAILFFTGPMKTIWEEPFDGGPSVFVANHDRAYGPIAMNVQFELCRDIRPWINAEVLSYRQAPAYIRKDYWWDLDKWYSPILSYTLAYVYALIIPTVLRGADCVPVYHDTGVMSTLRSSVKMLSDGKHLLLFPEHPAGYHRYSEKIFDGFVSVGRLYYGRTKEQVVFYPTYVDWKGKTIRVGKGIPYDPQVPYQEQTVSTTTEIETFFARKGL